MGDFYSSQDLTSKVEAKIKIDSEKFDLIINIERGTRQN